MKKTVVRSGDAPKSPLYSQAINAGGFVFVSGMAAIDPATQKLVGTTIQEQTRQALANCEQVLRAAGVTLADVVEVQALIARPEDFAGLNEVYAKTFSVDPPARSVARLGPEIAGLLVSIRMTAVAGKSAS